MSWSEWYQKLSPEERSLYNAVHHQRKWIRELELTDRQEQADRYRESVLAPMIVELNELRASRGAKPHPTELHGYGTGGPHWSREHRAVGTDHPQAAAEAEGAGHAR